MYKINFLKLVNIIKNSETNSVAYQAMKFYEPIVDLILSIIKHSPNILENVDLTEITLGEMLELVDEFIEKRRRKNLNQSQILNFCLKNKEKFRVSELLIILVFLLGTKKINLRKTVRWDKKGFEQIATTELIEFSIQENEVVPLKTSEMMAHDIILFLINGEADTQAVADITKKNKGSKYLPK